MSPTGILRHGESTCVLCTSEYRLGGTRGVRQLHPEGTDRTNQGFDYLLLFAFMGVQRIKPPQPNCIFLPGAA